MSTADRTWADWTTALWADAFDEPPFGRAALPELDAALHGALLHTANALAYYTPRIAEAFLRAAPPVHAHLTGDRFQAWANGGQTLAPQHWELAVEYFRVAPRAVPRLGEALGHWLTLCRQLAEVHRPLGITAMRHTPPFLNTAGPQHLDTWIAGARRLVEDGTRGTQLAEAFLATAAPVVARLPRDGIERWVTALVELSAGAPRAAHRVLQQDWTWFADLRVGTADVVVSLAHRFREISAAQARDWWITAADALPLLPPETADGLLALVAAVAGPAPIVARELIEHSPGALAQLPARHHTTLLGLLGELAAHHPQAALDFLTTSADLCAQLAADELRTWFAEGLALLRTNPFAATAFFRQESQASTTLLTQLRQVVHFESVAAVLQRYAEALCDTRLSVRSTEDMPFELRSLGRDLPTTDGRTIYLPPAIEGYGDRTANFLRYKLATARQAGYFECGTFRFDLDALADHAEYDALLGTARARGALRPTLSDYDRFFTLFAQPDLARDIFVACEDARVDHALLVRYPGLRAPLAAAVADALAQRPALHTLPLRQAAMEWIVRLSLTRLEMPDAPALLRPVDGPVRRAMGHVLHDTATVTTAALATMRIYTLLVRLPNFPDAPEAAVVRALEPLPAEFAEAPADQDWATFFPDAAEGESPYARPEDLPFRGVLRPELVQKRAVVQVLQDALRERAEEGQPLSAELLRQLLEMGVNLNIKKLDIQQLLESSDLFINDMEDRPGLSTIQEDLADLSAEEQQQVREVLTDLAAEVLDDPLPAERVFYYDEWDCEIEDYRHRWCRVKEVPVEPADVGIVQRIAREHADLIRSIRQQFQMVKPEQLQKVRRLPDGEEVDLNAAIEAVIDRRSRRTPDDRIYEERQRQQRDVATLFLIDVSASTDEWVEDPDAVDEDEEARIVPTATGRDPAFDDLRALWDPATVAPAGARGVTVQREQRIVDIERAAVVVMAEALQGLGDAYAIYGFSGYGRDNVDLFPVKTFEQTYGELVRCRLAGLEPHKSTRMGAAVRHATAQLAQQPAKIRTLILISDGYPQDMDYGKDRTSKVYGLHDTMVALQEARQAGILAYCLTVDQAGHDYLRQMCGGQDYLVIDDVRALPHALPKVYRGLTA